MPEILTAGETMAVLVPEGTGPLHYHDRYQLKVAGAEKMCIRDRAEGAEIDEELMTAISRCTDQIYPTEIINVSAELSDYLQNQMPANYIYNGEAALDELEALREAAVSN